MSDLSPSQQYYLQQMGIVCWQERQEKSTVQLASKADWLGFTQSLRHCDACHLCEESNETLGQGNLAANLVVVGLNMRVMDEKTKKLLENMLISIGLSERDIFVSDIFNAQASVTTQMKGHYLSHFKMQLSLIKPKVLLSFDKDLNIALRDLEIPLLALESLELMLKSPLKKRESYKKLLDLNQLLTINSENEKNRI